MFPIKDDNPTKGIPIITYLIIGINILIFAYEAYLALQDQLTGFMYAFSMIPREIIKGSGPYTLITSMFLHGGFMHIFGNMLYLYIFGDNIEDIMGKARFILFYILCGIAAASLHIFMNPSSGVPTLGASGAIAGVLGAYFVTFPRARVHCIVIFGYFIRWITLPAIFVLGFWFVIQVFSGIGSLAYTSQEEGGIAFFAHIGGFAAGMLLVKLFRK